MEYINFYSPTCSSKEKKTYIHKYGEKATKTKKNSEQVYMYMPLSGYMRRYNDQLYSPSSVVDIQLSNKKRKKLIRCTAAQRKSQLTTISTKQIVHTVIP